MHTLYHDLLRVLKADFEKSLVAESNLQQLLRKLCDFLLMPVLVECEPINNRKNLVKLKDEFQLRRILLFCEQGFNLKNSVASYYSGLHLGCDFRTSLYEHPLGLHKNIY